MPSPRLESDRSLVFVLCNPFSSSGGRIYTIPEGVHVGLLISIIVSLNFTIMVMGLYIISQALMSNTASNSNFWGLLIDSEITRHILFWSTFVVLFVVNVSCFITEMSIYSINVDDHLYSDDPRPGHTYTFIDFYTFINIPLICLFTLFEICTITVLTKNVTISPCILCISQSTVVKAIQVYAICNILWFAHRVGNCFIVSIYFIAIAPSQTIAVVTLCLSGIILFIISIASAAHLYYSTNIHNKCMKILKILIIMFILFSVIITLISFTLIFVDLTQHGLSASNMGSIILSLAIPSVMFVVSLAVKRQLKKDTSSNEQERASGYQQLQGVNIAEQQQ